MYGAAANRRFYTPDRSGWVLALTGLLFVLFSIFFARATERAPGLYPLYLLMLLQMTPFLYCFVQQDYNFIGFILFNHFFTYSVPKFNTFLTVFKVEALYPEALRAIQELTICTVFIIAGYFSAKMFIPTEKHKERFKLLVLSRWQLISVACYVIFVPLFLHYLPIWFLTFHFATMGADMMLLLSSTSPKHERLSFYLQTGVLVSTVWYFLTTGALTMVGVLAAYIFIAGCIRKKPSLFILPLFLTLVGSSVQNVKNDYRIYLANNPESNVLERADALFDLMGVMYVTGKVEDDIEGTTTTNSEDSDDDDEKANIPEDELEEKLVHGFARTGDDSLERVLDWTPRKVPFWSGETYQHIPFMFIPRVLWPDKPSRHIWNKFGRAYGYLSSDDFQTSVGVTYLAEAYMNYGFTGMYSVAFLFGVYVFLIEILSWVIFKGHFAFTFMIYLIPLQWYAADLGSILNSEFIVTGVLLIFGTQFKKMARRDEYS